MQPVGLNGRELMRGMPNEKVESKPALVFTAFIEQGSTVISVPKDTFEHLFALVTEPKTMSALRLTCKTFHQVSKDICPSPALPVRMRLILGESLIEKIHALRGVLSMESLVICDKQLSDKSKQGFEKNLKKGIEKGEKELCIAFKARCALLQIGFADLTKSAMTVADFILVSNSSRLSSVRERSNSIKVVFLKELSDDVCKNFHLTDITPSRYESLLLFHEVAYSMNGYRSNGQAEMYIRQSFHKGERFIERSAELCSIPKEQLAARIGKNLEPLLTAKKRALEAKMDELRGHDGFSGTIHAAWQRFESLSKAYEDGFKKFKEKFCTNEEECDFHAFQSSYDSLNEQKQEYDKAQQEYNGLVNELSQIAEFNEDGIIRGGDYFFVSACLEKTDDFAMRGAEKLFEFYQELTIPVTATNCAERHRVMKAITDFLCQGLGKKFGIYLSSLGGDICATSPRPVF